MNSHWIIPFIITGGALQSCGAAMNGQLYKSLFLIDCLCIGVRPRHQAIHDRLAYCLVLQEPATLNFGK